MPVNSGGSRVTDGALSSGAGSVTFATRYSYVQVTNLDTAPLYVTTDGSTPASGGGNNQYVVPPASSVLVPNAAPLWYQGQGVTNPGTTVNIAGATATAKYTVTGV